MKVTVRLNRSDLNKLQQRSKKQVIDKVARKGIQLLRQEITRRRLVDTGEMRDSVGAAKMKTGIKFEVDTDYAGILNQGVKPHKMKYLVGAGPLPIVKKKQKLFRVATKKNIREKGKWMHPGFKRGKGFVDNTANKIAIAGAIILENEIGK